MGTGSTVHTTSLEKPAMMLATLIMQIYVGYCPCNFFATEFCSCRETLPWLFMLLLTRGEEHRTYQPKSDLALWKSGLSRLLVEVNSVQGTSNDYTRLLLAAASVVRFANSVSELRQEKNFFLVCVYVAVNGMTFRLMLFEQGNNGVCFTLLCLVKML
ncbi:hypothetical protein BC835DRAFT_16853 [Cytidiella melzeri]|nr:hypothetical protein BC835DRAFT_16853 [Cytidiella melzeri]